MLNKTIILSNLASIVTLGVTFLRILGGFGAVYNLYVILCLLTTNKYIIVIPYLELNGNYCLAVALAIEVLLLLYLFQFRSLIMSLFVNVIIVEFFSF